MSRKTDSYNEAVDAIMSEGTEILDAREIADCRIVAELQNNERQNIRSAVSHGSTPSKRHRRNNLRFESMEQRLAMAGLDTPVWPQELPAGAPVGAIEQIDAHNGQIVYDISRTSDGSRFATAGQDNVIKVFDGENGSVKLTINGHTQSVSGVSYSPDGSMIASSSYDRTVKLWDSETGELKRQIDLPACAYRTDYSPDGRYLAIGLCGQEARLMDLQTNETFTIPSGMATAKFSFSADGKTMAFNTSNEIRLFDMQTKQLSNVLRGLSGEAYSVAIDPQGKYVVGGSNNGQTAIWNLQTKTLKVLQDEHPGTPEAPGGVWEVAFSADGRHMISSDWSGNILVRNVEFADSGVAPVIARYKVDGVITAIDTSPQNQTFIIAHGDRPDSTRLTILPLPNPPSLPKAPAENPPHEGDPDFIGPVPEDIFTLSMQEELDYLKEAAAQEMEKAGTSIDVESRSIPQLLRNKAEIEREITSINNQIGTVQGQIAVAQSKLPAAANAEQAEWLHYQDLIRRRFSKSAINNAYISYLTYKEIADNYRRTISTGEAQIQLFEQQKAVKQLSINDIDDVLSIAYARLRNQGTSYVQYAMLAGLNEEAAIAAISKRTDDGLAAAYEAMPHVRASAGILDKDISASGVKAPYFLDEPVTEVLSHTSPVFSKGGGVMKILGRVQNDGNRAGLVTVHFTGVSDLYPTMPDQYTLEVYLQPGEFRDYRAAIAVPAWQNTPPRVQIIASSPDEPDAITQAGGQRSKPMGPDAYEQGGQGAFERNLVSIMLSPMDEKLEKPLLLSNYLAAHPAEAGVAMAKINSGIQIGNAEITTAFRTAFTQNQLTAQQAVDTIMSEIAANIGGIADIRKMMDGVDNEDLRNLTDDQKALVALKAFQKLTGGETDDIIVSRVYEAMADMNSNIKIQELSNLLTEDGKILFAELFNTQLKIQIQISADTLVASTLAFESSNRIGIAKLWKNVWDRVKENITELSFKKAEDIQYFRNPDFAFGPETFNKWKAINPNIKDSVNGINNTLENANVATSKNTMVLVIYGSNQFPGDGIAGFENMLDDLRKNYPETWAISPGENPFEGYSDFWSGEAMGLIKELIKSRFQNNSNLKNIVFIGHSWGGGAIYELSNWLSNETNFEVKIKGTVYVDSVTWQNGTAENRIPINTENILNIYQSIGQANELYLNGGPLNYVSGVHIQEIDLDKNGDNYNHHTIDEAAVPLTIDFINNLILISK